MAAYFLPEGGVWDLLVKFKDGRYDRLTTDGVRFRYLADGTLDQVIDRYPNNVHALTRDTRGLLVRIDDKSVSADRFVRLGYYRLDSDANYDSTVDIITTNTIVDGKICRLLDYAGNDVLFKYSDIGLLTERDGPMVNGENGGYAGRCQTIYTYNGCQIVGVAVGTGAPLVTAAVANTPAGKPIANACTGAAGASTIAVPLGSAASNMSSQATSVVQPGSIKTAYTYDKFGHIKTQQVSGGKGGTPQLTKVTDTNGLVLFTQYPLGNTETAVFDTNNQIFRSRCNPVSRTVIPGTARRPRTPKPSISTRCTTVPSGVWVDADGFNVTYTLTPDSRDVASIFCTTPPASSPSPSMRRASSPATRRRKVSSRATPTMPPPGSEQTMTQGANTYTYSYDSSIAALLGMPTGTQPPLGAPNQVTYNNNMQEVEIKRGAYDETRSYDDRGLMTTQVQNVGGGHIRKMTMTYDEKAFLTNQIVDGLEVNGVVTPLQYTYVPDELSHLKTMTHPNGTTQTYSYDNLGNVIEMDLPNYYGNPTPATSTGNVTATYQGGDLVASNGFDGLDRPGDEPALYRKLR